MEPVSLKTAPHFDIEDAHTAVIANPLKDRIKKETITIVKPTSGLTVYINLPGKLSVEMTVFAHCCLIIGRAPNPPENIEQYAMLALDSNEISRTHLALFVENNTLFVQDMNSTNGSFMTVDDTRYSIEPLTPTPLSDHSIVEFGNAVLNIKLEK